MLTNQRSNEPAAMMAAADTGSSIYRTEVFRLPSPIVRRGVRLPSPIVRRGVRLPSPIVRRGVRLRAHQQGSGGVIECKGLEIRPIRGGYMLTNQRRVSVDQ